MDQIFQLNVGKMPGFKDNIYLGIVEDQDWVAQLSLLIYIAYLWQFGYPMWAYHVF